MEDIIYNQIMDKTYLGIITILDYETSVRKCLSEISIYTQNRAERKVIVDLALKVGINEYRFAAYNVTEGGKILWNSSTYIIPCDEIIKLANSFIKQRKDILFNSMLPSAAQNVLLR